MLFVSGQGGIDPATKAMAGPTFAEQGAVAGVLENLAVSGAGGRWKWNGPRVANITTVLLADAAFFPELNALFAEYFAASLPLTRDDDASGVARRGCWCRLGALGWLRRRVS